MAKVSTLIRASDELALFTAWTGGDELAGQRLLQLQIAPFRRYFGARLSADVDELTQRACLRLLEVGKSWRGKGSFASFAMGVARCVVLERFRELSRARRFGPLEVDGLGADPHSPVEMKYADLQVAMRTLAPRHREVLRMHYWDDRAVVDIASRTGVAPGTVKSRLHRARAALGVALSSPASEARAGVLESMCGQ